jgi:hypothetical protein
MLPQRPTVALVLAAISLAPGCRGDRGAEPAAAAATDDEPGPAAPGAAAAGDPAAPDRGAPAIEPPLLEPLLLAGGDRPGLAGALGPLRLGMTSEELREAAPELHAWTRTARSPDFPGVELLVHWTERRDRLRAVTRGPAVLSLVWLVIPDPDRGVIASLTRRWGEPLEPGSAQPLWLDEKERIRVHASQHAGSAKTTVFVEPYMPVAELLALDQPRFGFETIPLLGAGRADIELTYAVHPVDKDRPEADLFFWLPGTEYSADPTPVAMSFEGGVVTRVETKLNFFYHLGASDEILAALDRALGPADVREVDHFVTERTYRRRPELRVRRDISRDLLLTLSP